MLLKPLTSYGRNSMQAIPVHFQLKAMPKACQVLLKSGSNAQGGKAGHLISYRGRDKRRDKVGVSCYLVHFNFPISFRWISCFSSQY